MIVYNFIIMKIPTKVVSLNPKDELVFEETKEKQDDYYKTLEQNLEFWNAPEDDDIFAI